MERDRNNDSDGDKGHACNGDAGSSEAFRPTPRLDESQMAAATRWGG